MKKKYKEMPLIVFKGVSGKFVSLSLINNMYHADKVPNYTDGTYELTMITNDGYEIKIKPIKQEDARRIINCLKCSRGNKVNCWRNK